MMTDIKTWREYENSFSNDEKEQLYKIAKTMMNKEWESGKNQFFIGMLCGIKYAQEQNIKQ